jgi:spore maturation protein SpmB
MGCRHALLVCVLAACGRIGFGTGESSDATGTADGFTEPDALASAVIAHLALDDTPTDGATDASGNGHTAACNSTCPTLVAGHVGSGAYQFNGTTDFLIIQSTTELEPTSAITVTAWMMRSMVGASGIASKLYGTADLNSWQLRINAQLLLEICATASSGGCTANGAISGNVWHHVAFVWDGTVERSYLDGVRQTELPATVVNDGGRIILGADIDNGSPLAFLDGQLDDVWIYNTALQDGDIAAMAAL